LPHTKGEVTGRFLNGVFAILASASLLASTAGAATIAWEPAATVSGDSDVATDGVLVAAEHWAGVDASVNGVPFTAAQSMVVGSPGNSFETLTAANGYPQGNLTTSYWNILRGKWYNAKGTVTLNNLVAGTSYLVQIWSSDPRYALSQVETISGGPSLATKTGQFAIGTFTADAATQVLTVGGSGVLNAVQVRDLGNSPVGPVDPNVSTVTAQPSVIPPGGLIASTITVTLKDAGGHLIAGKVVGLASSRGAVDAISPLSVQTGASGTATFTVTSNAEGTFTLQAVDTSDGNLAIAQTATVTVQEAASHAPQASPDPIVFDQNATTDNLVVLMAAASEYSEGLTLLYSAPSVYPKHFWFNNFNSASQFMKWNVSLAQAGVYRVYARLSSGAAVPLKLSVEGTGAVLNFTTRNIGWDKLDAGTISIPAGVSRLVLRRNTAVADNVSIASLELIRESDRAAYEQRVAAFRADTTWFSRSKYGLMTQYGAWGYPRTGAKKSLEDFANGFDVPGFVAKVQSTGARYLIWSMTWWEYRMLAPIQAVDNIVGNGNRTSTRDVVGELASALHGAGIRFMLYYHSGHDGHLSYNSTDWWKAQHWPDALFTERGSGDRSAFFNNWVNVITEIGTRYGTNLDGFFFDDGVVYYPAPFERLGQAARTGNPARLVSFNPWVTARITDFQDVYFGEGSHGEAQAGSAPAGGDGRFIDGPHKGLAQHGMFMMERDWGVRSANQTITTSVTAAQAVAWVQSAGSRNVPLSFNMMFWEDQTCSQASLDVLAAVKAAMDPANHTEIAWEPAHAVSGDSDVSTVGAGLYAVRFHRSASADPTVNGVTFSDPGANISFSGTTQDGIGAPALLSAGYRQLLGSNLYTDGSLTFNNLTPGHRYLIQIWANDARSGAADGAVVFTTANSISLNKNTGGTGYGQYAIGVFTANKTTVTMSVSGGAFNAVQVRDLGSGEDYSFWASQYPDISGSTPDADPDGDGLSNLQEYAYGLNPVVGSPPSGITTPLDPDTKTFRYTRRIPLLSGLAYSVWISTDLQSWIEDAGAVQTPDARTGDTESVLVQLSGGASLSAPRLFVQVRSK